MLPDAPPNSWSDWIFANEVSHWCEGNSLVDWLNAFGTLAGFVADSARPGYDRRFDYLSLVVKQSWAFKRAVRLWLLAHSPLRTIATNANQVRDLAKALQTLGAMKAGVPIIANAVLWNMDDRVAGMVDLLVRSDVLLRLFPGAFAGEPDGAPAVSAPALGDVAYHYRAIDMKFATLQVLKDGSPAHEHLPSMVQNWIYNEALGKTQGYTPPASYLIGRDLFRAPARVGHSPELRRHATEGAAWIGRLRKEGAFWRPLPVPSIPELRPNLKAPKDQQWHRVKQEIAQDLHDLTLLPYVGSERRALAAAAGISRWDDPALSARSVGLDGSIEGRRLDAVLLANRSSGDQAVFPARFTSNVADWRQPAAAECFVSFQSVNDQADDFSRVPERGGTAMIFMITWGLVANGRWRSWQLVAHDLSLSAEAQIKLDWQAKLKRFAQAHGVALGGVRLFHWGNPSVPLPQMNWLDLLDVLIHREPVTVRGAFGFGLADFARALHALGLIETALPAVPGTPLEAMAGAWSAAKEAARLGIALEESAPVQVIGTFSQALCKSMMEIVVLLRQRASAGLSEAA